MTHGIREMDMVGSFLLYHLKDTFPSSMHSVLSHITTALLQATLEKIWILRKPRIPYEFRVRAEHPLFLVILRFLDYVCPEHIRFPIFGLYETNRIH